MNPIYLDYNATTPIDPAVAKAMMPFLKNIFGNPSSTHWYGVEARMAVMDARSQVASLLGCTADEIIFTSGGTEANNLALKGLAMARKNRGNHIITSTIEHPAILKVCEYLERQGFRISRIPVDRYGFVHPEDVAAAITDETILISIMLANNEVGTIQPLRAITDAAHARGVLVHTDASQAVGKIPVRIADLGVDMLTLAGHKIYASKGVGALFVAPGIQLEKQMHGADHELNRRAGTENVPGIVGLGKACEIIETTISQAVVHSRTLRDALQQGLLAAFPSAVVNGHPQKKLPNTLSISFPGCRANVILQNLPGVATSAGAACHATSVTISEVLTAMGLPPEIAMGTLRLSVGRFTTRQDVEKALPLLISAIHQSQEPA